MNKSSEADKAIQQLITELEDEAARCTIQADGLRSVLQSTQNPATIAAKFAPGKERVG